MAETWSGGVLVALAAAVAVLFAARVALFLGSCALADAGEPRLIKAVALVLLAAAVCVPASWWLLGYLKTQLPGSETALIGPAHVAWAAATCGIALVLPAVLYRFLLPATWKKGALIAGLEVVLGALLVALVAGVVLVVLAGVQVARRPAQTAGVATQVRTS